MTTMRHAAFLLLVGNILLSTTHALNVAIRGVSCDESLQVAVVRNSLNMTCSSTRGCTFGDTALIQGQFMYQGVNKLQLNYNSTAYMVGELDVTVDVIEIPHGTTLGLCGSDSVWITASETFSECPDSGIYNFEVTLQIPEYENDWWASGWHTGGEISLYTDADYSQLIGYCEVHIVTASHVRSVPSHAFSFYDCLFGSRSYSCGCHVGLLLCLVCLHAKTQDEEER